MVYQSMVFQWYLVVLWPTVYQSFNGIPLNGIMNGIPINGLSMVFGSIMTNGISFVQWYTIEWYSEWYISQRSFNGIW